MRLSWFLRWSSFSRAKRRMKSSKTSRKLFVEIWPLMEDHLPRYLKTLVLHIGTLPSGTYCSTLEHYLSKIVLPQFYNQRLKLIFSSVSGSKIQTLIFRLGAKKSGSKNCNSWPRSWQNMLVPGFRNWHEVSVSFLEPDSALWKTGSLRN